MPTKRHSSEQIISKLREAKVHLSLGMTIPLMCQKPGLHITNRSKESNCPATKFGGAKHVQLLHNSIALGDRK